MEMYPPPKSEVTAEEVLMRLISRMTDGWSIQGVRIWVNQQLEEINKEEQLRLFEGENDDN